MTSLAAHITLAFALLGVATSRSHDLIVYGGTPAGVAAAVTAGEAGLDVLLVSERSTVGGAMANGLAATDIGSKSAISGFPKTRITGALMRHLFLYERYAPSWRAMVQGTRDGRCYLCGVSESAIGTLKSPFYQLAKLPNGKYDFNSGRSSLMNVVTTPAYFDSRAARAEFEATLAEYMQNFFVFLQTDPAVDRKVQEAFKPFGLCADEFTDNENWPREPYLREGRRMVGRYTMIQKDLFDNRVKTGAVALSSYAVDSKLSQISYNDGAIYRDSGPDAHVKVPIYEVPYWAMLPQNGTVTNLVATVGLSASPVAYGSLRMEPQYMAIGEAAGAAAIVAKETDTDLYDVSVELVQARLALLGVIYKAKDACLRAIPTSARAGAGFSPDCEPLPVAPVPIEW